ncbi:MAG: V-type ATPase subunit subunit G family protein [Coriobacteriia bacterium]|nr:V-type ATPase subunit subunit G family protein [Coriobacteriia bacterium]
MDEKVLEEIRFHQDVVTKDANSPLFQIREKEMEISGRVLAARNQAEKIVSDARSEAAKIVKGAGSDAERLSTERTSTVLKETEASVTQVEAQGAADVEALRKTLVERQGEAADLVVRLVTTF